MNNVSLFAMKLRWGGNGGKGEGEGWKGEGWKGEGEGEGWKRRWRWKAVGFERLE